MMRHQPSSVPPQPGVVQRRLALPPDAHGAVCHRRVVAHPVLLVAPAIAPGARGAGVARRPAGGSRLGALIVPPFAGTEPIRGRRFSDEVLRCRHEGTHEAKNSVI
jgi:hypothetical protein